jgi:pimeloyl-ACP methyl ester carboxylesterase
MARRPTLLLVHSPLTGPSAWKATAALLRDAGYPVAVSSLAGAVDAGPPYYRQLAEAAVRPLLDSDRHAPVVLVGHSGAGALLPMIAEVAGADVRAAVFVDAVLPHPGTSALEARPAGARRDLAGLVHDGRLPPWHRWFPPEVIEGLLPEVAMRERFATELPELPMAYFEEPAPPTRGWSTIRCAYVRLSEPYEPAATEADARGWPVYREAADHLALLTRPDLVADAVAEAVAAATSDRPSRDE